MNRPEDCRISPTFCGLHYGKLNIRPKLFKGEYHCLQSLIGFAIHTNICFFKMILGDFLPLFDRYADTVDTDGKQRERASERYCMWVCRGG